MLNGAAVVTRLATQLVLTKVLAVYLGPVGFGAIGQFQNLVSIVTSLASGAVQQGVTKCTAESAGDRERQRAVWVTAGTIGLFGSAAVGTVLVLLRESIATWIFGDAANASVLIWLAASLFFLVLNGLLLAILNGCKAVGALVAAHIVGSIVSAVVATVLVLTMGLKGALLAVCVSQAFAFAFTAWQFRRECAGTWRDLVGRINGRIARDLGGFALMAATTAIVATMSQFVIRSHVIDTLGWSDAGIWQALSRISDIHLLLITSTLSVYFLPHFAEIRDAEELRKAVFGSYRFILPTVLLSSFAIFLFRERLVHVALTSEFQQVANLISVQLVGDIFKAGSWVMGFTMISHARTRTFIFTEIVFSTLFTAASITLIGRYGLWGATFAYALTYAVYWCTMYFFFLTLTRDLSRAAETSSAKPAVAARKLER